VEVIGELHERVLRSGRKSGRRSNLSRGSKQTRGSSRGSSGLKGSSVEVQRKLGKVEGELGEVIGMARKLLERQERRKERSRRIKEELEKLKGENEGLLKVLLEHGRESDEEWEVLGTERFSEVSNWAETGEGLRWDEPMREEDMGIVEDDEEEE
jgi:hypothetical protein